MTKQNKILVLTALVSIAAVSVVVFSMREVRLESIPEGTSADSSGDPDKIDVADRAALVSVYQADIKAVFPQIKNLISVPRMDEPREQAAVDKGAIETAYVKLMSFKGVPEEYREFHLSLVTMLVSLMESPAEDLDSELDKAAGIVADSEDKYDWLN